MRGSPFFNHNNSVPIFSNMSTTTKQPEIPVDVLNWLDEVRENKSGLHPIRCGRFKLVPYRVPNDMRIKDPNSRFITVVSVYGPLGTWTKEDHRLRDVLGAAVYAADNGLPHDA